MAAVEQTQNNAQRAFKKVEAIIEIFGEYMKVSYESDDQTDTGENAYEEDEFENQETEITDVNKFIDNITVVSNTKRPTIFLRYNADIDFTDSFVAEPSEENIEEEEEEPTIEDSGFTAEEIVEIAEGSLGTGSPFASHTANAKIAEIIAGPQASQFKSYEAMQPWQLVGSQFIGNAFLNETTFYQFAEVETPDTDENISTFGNYINLQIAENIVSLQKEIDQDSAAPVVEANKMEVEQFEVAKDEILEFTSFQAQQFNSGNANTSLETKFDATSLVQIGEMNSMGFNSFPLF